jgi:ParB-like chromosome segregation protein Spo0J
MTTPVRYGESAEKEQKAKALLRAGGLSRRAIGREVGTSVAQISRFAEEIEAENRPKVIVPLVLDTAIPTEEARPATLAERMADLERQQVWLEEQIWSLAGAHETLSRAYQWCRARILSVDGKR